MQWRGLWFGLKRGYRDNAPSRKVRDADPVWLSDTHRSQLLCFVHVPKAAGTSLKNVLFRVYGRGFVANRRLADNPPETVTPEQAKDILAIGGHLPYGFHRRFGPQANGADAAGLFAGRELIYVSVVRNPVDRLLSLCRFVRTFPPHPLHQQAKHMTSAQFFDHLVETGNKAILGNQQCSLLTGGQPDRAIEYADNRFFAVSTTAGIAAMVDALGERLDWPEVEIENKNVSPRSLTDESDRRTAEALCDQFCKGDIALFEHVQAKPSGLFVKDG